MGGRLELAPGQTRQAGEAASAGPALPAGGQRLSQPWFSQPQAELGPPPLPADGRGRRGGGVSGGVCGGLCTFSEGEVQSGWEVGSMFGTYCTADRDAAELSLNLKLP